LTKKTTDDLVNQST